MNKCLFLCVALILSAGPTFALTTTSPAPPVNPMFDRFVAVGDSLSHGAQSMCIDETRQQKSFLATIARQVNTTFLQPLLKFPGFFVNIEDLGKGNIKWYEYAIPVAGGKRLDNYKNQDKLNNYAVSGATVGDVLRTPGDNKLYSLPKLVLGKKGAPQLDQALKRRPTFLSAWIGGNDVLSCAILTDTSKLTPLDEFIRDYTEMVSRIIATPSIRGVMTATIPDCTSIAYLQPANNPDLPAGSMKAFWNTSAGDNDEVLDPSELQHITERTMLMNQEIERLAAANGWALLDAFSVLRDIAVYGHVLKDTKGRETGPMVNTEYLGGFFSLDGFHPSVTGHAVMANYFIEAINEQYGLAIAPVDEVTASQGDSLYTDPYDPRGIINSWFGQAVQFFVEMFI